MERSALIFTRMMLVCFALLLVSTAVSAQNTSGFRYVIPRFNSTSGSELVVTNLSSRLATPEVTFINTGTQHFADTFMNVQAGSQTRLTAQAFGFPTFAGSIVITSGVPLSVMATVVEPNGSFDSIVPPDTSTNLIL